jgi:hypothetical protein
MLHSLGKPSVANGSSYRYEATGRKVNGIIVTSTQMHKSTQRITVTKTKRNQSDQVFINRIPLDKLAVISNLVGGQSMYRESMLITGNPTETGNATATVGRILYGVRIPLGSHHLEDGESFVIDIENGHTAAQIFSVSTYTDKEEQDYSLRYQLTTEINRTFRDVHSLWLVSGGSNVYDSTKDVQVLKTANGESYMAQAWEIGGYTASALFVEELTASDDVLLLHINNDVVPDVVGLEFSGSDSGGLQIIQVTKEYDETYHTSQSAINSGRQVKMAASKSFKTLVFK